MKDLFLPRFNKKLIRALVGEFLATFLFMFAICGVSLANKDAGPMLPGMCCAFAAIASIYAFGDASGAHFNPAVTFGAVVGARMPVVQGLMYLLVQLGATFLVCALLQMFYPHKDVFRSLVIHGGDGVSQAQIVAMEAVLSFILVMVVYGTVLGGAPKLMSYSSTDSTDEEAGATDQASDDKGKEKQGVLDKVLPLRMGNKETIIVKPTALFAGLAIGFTLGFLCYLGGAVSGGAFNPARATAPAVIAKQTDGLWMYWLGDLIGALLAAIIYNFCLEV